MKKNDGYTLVEMIIVIAIIVILSGMAYLSLSVLSSAKARDKAIDFDTEIATLAAKSRSMDANYIDGAKTYNQFCLVIYKSPSGKDIYEAPGYYDTVEDEYVVDCAEKKKFSRRVGLEYNQTFDDTKTVTELHDDDSTFGTVVSLIRYNRRGECVEGYGSYTFTTDRNSTGVARTKIRQNGSHETR